MVATNNDTRVDTTFIGYLLIGFVLLLVGIYGLQSAGVFGHTYKDLPLDFAVLGRVYSIVGLILVILTIFAYRIGKKTSTGAFAFFGVYYALYGLTIINKTDPTTVTNSMWFFYVAAAIFALIFAIYEIFNKTPKFLAVLFLVVALYAFFLGLTALYGAYGTNDANIHDVTALLYGIFALLGFIVAVYLGLAYADPKKIPLI